jgi:hypothetical protein
MHQKKGKHFIHSSWAKGYRLLRSFVALSPTGSIITPTTIRRIPIVGRGNLIFMQGVFASQIDLLTKSRTKSIYFISRVSGTSACYLEYEHLIESETFCTNPLAICCMLAPKSALVGYKKTSGP